MKSYILIVIAITLLGLPSSVIGQNGNKGGTSKPNDNIKTIEIDFDAIAKDFKLKEPPKFVGEGGSIDIIVTNFNPFLYNLNIYEKQGVYQNNEKLSEKATGSVSYSQLNFNLKDLNINIGSVSPTKTTYTDVKVSKTASEITTFIINIQSKEASLKRKLLELEQLQEKSKLDSNFLQQIPGKKLEIENEKNEIDSLNNLKKAKENDLDIYVKGSKEVSDRLLRYNEKVKNLLDNLKNLNHIIAYYRTLTNTSSVDGLNFNFANRRKISNFKSYFPSWNPTSDVNISVYLNNLIEQLQQSYIEVSRSYNELYLTLQEDKEILKDNFQKAESIYNSINFEMYGRLIDLIDKLYLSINENLFTIHYSTKIIDDDADAIYFDLIATPVTSADNGIPLQPARISFSIPVKGGAKIDVATGFAFNIGLTDKTYRYKSSGNGTYNVIENRNFNLFNPTVVVMAHLYRRNSIKSHRPNLCFGIGTADAERIRYYLGASWIIGRKQRMNFCAGAVGGQVDYADPSVLDTDYLIKEQDLNKPIPLTQPAPFRVGGFLAITLNLTGSNSMFAQKIAKAK